MPILALIAIIIFVFLTFMVTLEESDNIMKIILSIIFIGSFLFIGIAFLVPDNFEYEHVNTLQIIKGENGKKILIGVYENKIINLTEKGIYIENPDKYNLKVIKEQSSGGIDWMINDKFNIEENKNIKKELVK